MCRTFLGMRKQINTVQKRKWTHRLRVNDEMIIMLTELGSFRGSFSLLMNESQLGKLVWSYFPIDQSKEGFWVRLVDAHFETERESLHTTFFFVDLVLDTDIYIQSKLFFFYIYTEINGWNYFFNSFYFSNVSCLFSLFCFVFSICRLEIGCREKVKGKVEKDSSKRKCFVVAFLRW